VSLRATQKTFRPLTIKTAIRIGTSKDMTLKRCHHIQIVGLSGAKRFLRFMAMWWAKCCKALMTIAWDGCRKLAYVSTAQAIAIKTRSMRGCPAQGVFVRFLFIFSKSLCDGYLLACVLSGTCTYYGYHCLLVWAHFTEMLLLWAKRFLWFMARCGSLAVQPLQCDYASGVGGSLT
jgi:hypothetical protein